MIQWKWIPKILMAALASSLAGCGTLYLHSNADQKAMDGAIGGMAAAKQSQLAVLADHRTALQTLIAQERAAVTAENLRLRDSLLIRVINEPNKSKAWKPATVNAVKQQLLLAAGLESLPAPKLAKPNGESPSIAFANFVEAWERRQRQLPAARRRVARAEANAKAQGATIKKPCSASGELGDIEVPANNDNAKSAAEDAQALCRQIKLTWDKEGVYESSSKQPELIRCMMDDRAACETGAAKALPAFLALGDALDVDALIDVNRKLAKAAQEHLGELEENYKCALNAESKDGAGSLVGEAARLIGDFVDMLPNSATELNEAVAPPAAPATPPASGVTASATAGHGAQESCPGKPELLTFEALLKKAGFSKEDLKKLLDGLTKIKPGETVVAAIADAKAAYAQSRLADLLAASADPKATLEAGRTEAKPANSAAIEVAGFVALLDPVTRLIAAEKGGLPDTRAVLVDLAVARYERALAQIEIDRLTRSKDAMQVRAQATVRQLSALANAYLNAEAERREQAILALADAWNRGAIPAAAAGVELRGYRYAAWTAREEAATQASYSTIEPLLTELQNYAAGGFTADEIARAISALGIVGIAVGVN